MNVLMFLFLSSMAAITLPGALNFNVWFMIAFAWNLGFSIIYIGILISQWVLRNLLPPEEEDYFD